MSGPGPSAPAGLGEFGRIERYLRPLAAGFPGALGLNDDAALVDVPLGHQLVVTTDAMVAGVHFLPSDPPADIAHKLLAVNLSDLAAKGATPLAYSLVTGLPKDTPDSWLAAFAAGLGEGQARWGIHLAGGDSVSTAGPMNLTISALGLVPTGRMVRRAGARPGDLVFVSGCIGDGVLGLMLALGTLERPDSVGGGDYLLSRLRRPEPRLPLAPVLLAHASAAADVSDGLVADVGHIASASGVRVVIDSATVPVSDPALGLLAEWPGLLAEMLTGGDDYEVVFTAPADHRNAILAAAASAGVPVTAIGRVEVGEGVSVLDRAGQPLSLGKSGWQHF
ncbi:thiamine-phosphate kinase [Aerophototrophica crusticola]|uniref:Thiamine-monophosphate kinase n=1 Tax=Aerophototrophica crusticola TaxID=1709002 RepID=A0A858R5M2_9PROT|nr:thiamine-phosphate kinase [Rhodospirillaceae bacterium B3]